MTNRRVFAVIVAILIAALLLSYVVLALALQDNLRNWHIVSEVSRNRKNTVIRFENGMALKLLSIARQPDLVRASNGEILYPDGTDQEWYLLYSKVVVTPPSGAESSRKMEMLLQDEMGRRTKVEYAWLGGNDIVIFSFWVNKQATSLTLIMPSGESVPLTDLPEKRFE